MITNATYLTSVKSIPFDGNEDKYRKAERRDEKSPRKHATKPGERIFIDTAGPYHPTLQGSKYWVKIVCDATGRSFDYFIGNKSEVPGILKGFISKVKAKGHEVKFVRCDNAGEHQSTFKSVCDAAGVTKEFTAPHSPQMNGPFERRFATNGGKALASMIQACLTDVAQQLLWAEACSAASENTNIMCNTKNKQKSPLKLWTGELSSDPGEPKTLKQAINGKDKSKWIPSVKSEFMNFISRGVWKKVKREKVKALGQKPLGTKWVFKVKVEQDGSRQYKLRCVALGYLQIPGVDFTETFSPVASDSTIRITLGVFLYKEKPKSWVLEMIDIEAAFLEADQD